LDDDIALMFFDLKTSNVELVVLTDETLISSHSLDVRHAWRTEVLSSALLSLRNNVCGKSKAWGQMRISLNFVDHITDNGVDLIRSRQQRR
jgi:hypothetical protein